MATSPIHSHRHSGYLPYIDGLRAFAIISVVIFHASPSSLRGGFVGVDIFFVISGFLISGIIFRGLHKGKFSFSDFYIRRIRRIFPALLLVLSICMLCGWYWLLTNDFIMLGKHVTSSLSFIQNLVLYGEAGYFDTASEYKPLMHLWSLSVEEQFYLLFPLMMWLLWRLKINIPITLGVTVLISFCLNLALVGSNEAGAFFLPQARFWEIMAGSLLAYFLLFPQHLPFSARFISFSNSTTSDDHHKNHIHNIICILGVIFLLFSVIVIRQSRPFPGIWALFPVLGSVLVILAGPQAWINRRILGSRPAVWIGLISYPLYLWHWPILSFLRILANGKPSWQLRTFGVALSFLLAWLTYRLLEKHIRYGGYRRLKTLCLFLVAIGLGISGWQIYTEKIDPKSKQYGVDDIIAAIIEWEDPKILSPMQINGIDVRGIEGNKLTLFYGDSNMWQYTSRIAALLRNSDKSRGAIFLTKGGCPPIAGAHRKSRPQCDVMQDQFFQLAKSDRVDRIVIAGAWVEYYPPSENVLIDNIPLHTQEGIAKSIRAMDLMLKEISSQKKTYLVLNIPLHLGAGSLVKRDVLKGEFDVQDKSLNRHEFEKQHAFILEPMKEIAQEHGIKIIDPLTHLCSKDFCPALSPEGKAMYKDGDHLRPTYVKDHVKYLDETIQ